MKVLLHETYSTGKLENLFNLALENGCDGIEIHRLNRGREADQEAYCRKAAELKNAHPEMEIVFSIGAVKLSRGNPDEVAAEIDIRIKFMEWAARECGVRVMNFYTDMLSNPGGEPHMTGSAQATESDYEKNAAHLRILGDAAASFGALLVIETHHGYLHDIPASCRKLIDLVEHDAVGINYDAGNIFLNQNGGTVADAFNLIGDKIYYAHLKNLLKLPNSYMAVTHLEDGHINQMEVMAGLKTHLRSGMLAIEYPASGDGVIAARRDMDYVRFMKSYLKIGD